MAAGRHAADLPSPVSGMLERVDDSRYPGGKALAGLWQWLLGMMPTHAEYVEPFVGKGGLFRRKPPALTSLLFDKDPEVCDWWKRQSWPGAHIINGDGVCWLRDHAAELHYDRLIYCDPPYLHRTRKKTRLYRFEMTDRDHRRFLRAVLAARCAVMISGYASPLYDDALATWSRFTRHVITRGRTMAEEVCWCNFDPEAQSPAVALAYHRLGRTFRERERVSKRIKRWVTRLLAMPCQERRAVLLSLLEAERRRPTPATTMETSVEPGWLCRSLLDGLDEERSA